MEGEDSWSSEEEQRGALLGLCVHIHVNFLFIFQYQKASFVNATAE
jgi:hypothetical protein